MCVSVKSYVSVLQWDSFVNQLILKIICSDGCFGQMLNSTKLIDQSSRYFLQSKKEIPPYVPLYYLAGSFKFLRLKTYLESF